MQDGNTALELTKDAATFECLRAAGAKMPDITDENKNALLLRYAEKGAAALVRVLLQAGANVAHTDGVRVCACGQRVVERDAMRLGGRMCSTCPCARIYIYTHIYIHTYICMYIYACMYICACMSIHTYM